MGDELFRSPHNSEPGPERIMKRLKVQYFSLPLWPIPCNQFGTFDISEVTDSFLTTFWLIPRKECDISEVKDSSLPTPWPMPCKECDISGVKKTFLPTLRSVPCQKCGALVFWYEDEKGEPQAYQTINGVAPHSCKDYKKMMGEKFSYNYKQNKRWLHLLSSLLTTLFLPSLAAQILSRYWRKRKRVRRPGAIVLIRARKPLSPRA